ncbi:hypothetical protein [Magnetospira thiophila]
MASKTTPDFGGRAPARIRGLIWWFYADLKAYAPPRHQAGKPLLPMPPAITVMKPNKLFGIRQNSMFSLVAKKRNTSTETLL